MRIEVESKFIEHNSLSSINNFHKAISIVIQEHCMLIFNIIDEDAHLEIWTERHTISNLSISP